VGADLPAVRSLILRPHVGLQTGPVFLTPCKANTNSTLFRTEAGLQEALVEQPTLGGNQRLAPRLERHSMTVLLWPLTSLPGSAAAQSLLKLACCPTQNDRH
jgi:hypothetical protein